MGNLEEEEEEGDDGEMDSLLGAVAKIGIGIEIVGDGAVGGSEGEYENWRQKLRGLICGSKKGRLWGRGRRLRAQL